MKMLYKARTHVYLKYYPLKESCLNNHKLTLIKYLRKYAEIINKYCSGMIIMGFARSTNVYRLKNVLNKIHSFS